MIPPLLFLKCITFVLIYLTWANRSCNALRCRPSKWCPAVSSHFTWVPPLPPLLPLLSLSLFLATFFPPLSFDGKAGLSACCIVLTSGLSSAASLPCFFSTPPVSLTPCWLVDPVGAELAGCWHAVCLCTTFFGLQWQYMEDVSWLRFETVGDQWRNKCIQGWLRLR